MMNIDTAHGPILHLLFEALAYAAGFRYFLYERRRQPAAALPPLDSLWICAGAIAGAALGSKIAFWTQYSDYIYAHRFELAVLLGGKTIVGGLLGGLIGIELTKRIRGVHRSTGDTFVFPLIAGMLIGRLGCLFGGIEDNTYGNPTGLPWAVVYADGIPRHPAPLYEALFLVVAWIVIARCRDRLTVPGDAFRLFMTSYLIFRFAVDFQKPPHFPTRTLLELTVPAGHLYFGMLTGIQLCCLAGLAYYARDFARIVRELQWRK